MPEALINRLAERLGCSPEAAATALRQFVEQLHQQLEQAGQATVAGLGRFIRTEQGLQFEPDTSLAQAVNHRFAGLEPVTVEPPAAQPYRKTEVVPPEEEPTEKASPFYEVTGEQEAEPASPEATAQETEPAAEEHQTEPASEPAPIDTPQPAPQPDEPPLRPPRPPRIRVEEHRRRGLPVWIPAALLIVVFGVVAVWLLFFSQPSPREAVPPAPVRAETEQSPAPETTATATATPAVTDTVSAATETPPAETSAPAAPPTSNYALIVGSVTSQRAAEQLAARFRRTLSEHGLPVTIVTVTNNGTTRYRVAVGRYRSTEEALTAKRQLGEVLPPDAWVLRLPSTTQ
ncbi:MAG: SPOR domain-containing protein [Rhodothermus sp.]|nr:SPOR domain-containing protein [Rhodothermus sp.]